MAKITPQNRKFNPNRGVAPEIGILAICGLLCALRRINRKPLQQSGFPVLVAAVTSTKTS
jgi:hypothetical protein